MKILGRYKNGNYKVTILNDGTKIRETEENAFLPEFPECMDVKITDKCDGGCLWCYEGCSINGKHADLIDGDKPKQKWIESLKPYTELALNGNDLTHPQLREFLEYLKSKKVIANITVNQRHFLEKFDFIEELVENKLIYGVGVSLSDSSENVLYEYLEKIPNTVIHTIAGILAYDDIVQLMNHHCKVLILGYKKVGRGEKYYQFENLKIDKKIAMLKLCLSEMIKECKVVSFDNLAINQLDVKNTLFKDRSDWDEFYMGDDGEFTFYIDAVNQTYSKNSLNKDECFQIKDNVIEMFNHVKTL